MDEKRRPQIIAHRGGAGLWPENTEFALQASLKLGADANEVDIRATKDGVLVLIHDESVDRTTSGSGLVRNMTLAELQQLDAGYRWTSDRGKTFPYRNQGLTIPTLDSIFRKFPETFINLDIKEPTPDVLKKLKTLIKRHNMTQHVLLVSYQKTTAKKIRQWFPDSKIGATDFEMRLFSLLSKLRIHYNFPRQANFLEAPLNLVDKHFISAAHRQNKNVYVWTVNDERDIRRLHAWQVDGIVTDYPDRLIYMPSKT